MDAHKTISFIKSAIRLVGFGYGYVLAQDYAVVLAFLFLFVAEIVGIVEELVV